MPPLGGVYKPAGAFREHHRTRCTRSEARPSLGEEDLATALATPGPTGLGRDGGRVDRRGKTSGAAAAAEACRACASGKRCRFVTEIVRHGAERGKRCQGERKIKRRLGL